jgi:hypothetical protein
MNESINVCFLIRSTSVLIFLYVISRPFNLENISIVLVPFPYRLRIHTLDFCLVQFQLLRHVGYVMMAFLSYRNTIALFS